MDGWGTGKGKGGKGSEAGHAGEMGSRDLRQRDPSCVNRVLYFFNLGYLASYLLRAALHAICGSCAWFPLPGAYLSCDWLVNTSYPISSARNSLASENRWQLSDVANFLNIEDEKNT
jgi:hypothetical protein